MSQEIPVLYGTETGNAADCAEQLAESIEALGYASSAIDLADFDCDDLCDLPLVFIVSSTHGNGDPPENAEELMDFLKYDEPDLETVQFAVCGLGDTAYPYFAQCGKDFDKYMEQNGARRILPRMDCDESFEVPFNDFKNSVVQYLRENDASVRQFLGLSTDHKAPEAPKAHIQKPQAALGSRENPFVGRLVKKMRLSGTGSKKETMHYEVDFLGVAVSYNSGDCFGVFPHNNPSEVDSILSNFKLIGEEIVHWKEESLPIRTVLQTRACLQRISVDFLKLLATDSPKAKAAVDGGSQTMTEYLNEHHLLDASTQSTVALDAQTLADHLYKIQPRLYSIASSPETFPTTTHFCIETLRYTRNERPAEGVASTWLADRMSSGDSLSLYLHPNNRFRLPTDDRPIIMIGPGTGIAPFRAFLQEKQSGAFQGDTWLFFGHQHAEQDYLYKSDIERFRQDGILNKLDLAWSRDQQDKVYVQHKMWENKEELWSWIQRGASIYVCGAIRMGEDVDAVLRKVATHFGEDESVWMEELDSSGRYLRDVY